MSSCLAYCYGIDAEDTLHAIRNAAVVEEVDQDLR
jgi:hypothetical protein